jgi:hypothetical protein
MPQIGPAVSPTQKRQRANKRRLANPPLGRTFCPVAMGDRERPTTREYGWIVANSARREMLLIDTAIFY